MRIIVACVFFILGLCAVAGAGAMPAHPPVRIECCVVPGLFVAPVRLELAPIGLVVLSLVALQLGFFTLPRGVILEPACSSVAPASVRLRC